LRPTEIPSRLICLILRGIAADEQEGCTKVASLPTPPPPPPPLNSPAGSTLSGRVHAKPNPCQDRHLGSTPGVDRRFQLNYDPVRGCCVDLMSLVYHHFWRVNLLMLLLAACSRPAAASSRASRAVASQSESRASIHVESGALARGVPMGGSYGLFWPLNTRCRTRDLEIGYGTSLL
jgi:hypothetical protein